VQKRQKRLQKHKAHKLGIIDQSMGKDAHKQTVKQEKTKMKKPAGIILYKGASALDRSREIVVIATLSSNNRKTGDMVQVWILSEDTHPVQLSADKQDHVICGNCPHRQSLGGACYVNIGQAPAAVFKAYQRGLYPVYDASKHDALFKGRKIRLGAYGDPAAMPFEIAEHIVSLSDGHTAYTHQQKHAGFDPRFLSLCMVSADTPKQAAAAHAIGAKTFRIAVDITNKFDNEIECLSDSKGISCHDCGICKGSSAPVSIVIAVHGSRKGNFLNNRKAA
jgi:hypothetical protein